MTEPFNPYTVLGLNRSADAKTIKKAYRKKAAGAHPDMPGGSPEAFAAVKRAYDMLSDEARKRAFDIHGLTDDKPPQLDDAVLHGALHVLQMELAQVVRTATSVGKLDLLHLMRTKMRNGLEQLTGHMMKTQEQLSNARDLRARFEAKGDKTNFIGQILDREVRDAEEILKKGNVQVEGVRMALRLLDDHTYRRDAPAKGDGFGRTYDDQLRIRAGEFFEEAGFMLPGPG